MMRVTRWKSAMFLGCKLPCAHPPKVIRQELNGLWLTYTLYNLCSKFCQTVRKIVIHPIEDESDMDPFLEQDVKTDF